MNGIIKEEAHRLALPILKKGYKSEGCYPYNNQDGENLYYRLRCKHPVSGDKWIRPMSKNGNGYHLKEPEFKDGKPLYRLDHLHQNRESIVYFVEGENKVKALNKLGLVATTSGGASSARTANFNPLKGREIILWPDYDEHGQRHMQEVAERLLALDCKVFLIEVDKLNLQEKDDVVDWLKLHPNATSQDIQALPVIKLGNDTNSHDSSSECWPECLPIETTFIPEWPKQCFPDSIQQYVDALAEFSQTPIELATMVAFAILATASQRKYAVEMATDYREQLCLWTCIALPPANRKTSVFESLKKPLDEYQKKEGEKLKSLIGKALSEKQTLEEIIKQKRKEAVRLKGERLEEITSEIAELELSIPKVPHAPQLWCGDITPEALGSIMASNSEKMAILSDEGGIFETFAGRYSSGVANLDVALKAHCGSSVTINRQHQIPIQLELPCLTIGVAVQPEVIQGMAKKDGFRGRGFIGRMLFAVPRSKIGNRKISGDSIPEGIKKIYLETIKSILWRDLEFQSLDSAHEREQWIIKPSDNAQSHWREYWLQIENKMKEGGVLAEVSDWAGKLPGQIARIACLIHIARYVDRCPEGIPISLDDMQMATRIGDALAGHALMVFDLMSERPEMEMARKLSKWIKREAKSKFTSREAIRGNGFRNRESLDRAVKVLEELGWLREVEREVVSYRPSDVWEVNPKAIEKTGQSE